jgi:hypothetical protein
MLLRKVKCKNCTLTYETQESVSTCPYCGHKNGGDGLMALIAIVLVVAFAALLGGLFALFFYGFLWLFGLNKKWRILIGVAFGLLIGFFTSYVIIFESGVASNEFWPIIAIAVGGAFAYYYLYRQYKFQSVDGNKAPGHLKLRMTIIGLLILACIATYYSLNTEKEGLSNKMVIETSRGASPSEGKSEDYSGTSYKPREGNQASGNKASVNEETQSSIPETAEEADAVTEIPASGMAEVLSERAYFFKDDKLTQRKAYLVRGQSFEFSESDGEFVYARFINEQGIETKGWIKAADCGRFRRN